MAQYTRGVVSVKMPAVPIALAATAAATTAPPTCPTAACTASLATCGDVVSTERGSSLT
jgi:hypothetical protein